MPSNKTMEQLQEECHQYRSNLTWNRSILLAHYEDDDWRRFKDNRGRPAYKFWSRYVKNEYGITKATANRTLRAAIIERELGIPPGIHIRESVLRVLWSVDRDVDTNKKAFEIAKGIAARDTVSKHRSVSVNARIMTEALLMASGKTVMPLCEMMPLGETEVQRLRRENATLRQQIAMAVTGSMVDG